MHAVAFRSSAAVPIGFQMHGRAENSTESPDSTVSSEFGSSTLVSSSMHPNISVHQNLSDVHTSIDALDDQSHLSNSKFGSYSGLVPIDNFS